VLALVVAALVVSYASSLRTWSEQQARIADLRAEVAEREQRVAAYERQIRRWDDPAYVEIQARERFGWVLPGEVGYLVVGDEQVASGEPADGGGGEGTARPVTPWYESLWSSVERAGVPPRPPAPEPAKPSPAERIGPESG